MGKVKSRQQIVLGQVYCSSPCATGKHGGGFPEIISHSSSTFSSAPCHDICGLLSEGVLAGIQMQIEVVCAVSLQASRYLARHLEVMHIMSE